MGHIFISYSRKDSKIVDQLVNQIEDSGYQVWIDRGGIQAGEQWRASIVEAIEGADLVVVILSNKSVSSDNLRKEVDLSETRRKPILPVKIEEVDIPPGLEYQLSGIQTLDFATEGIQSLLKSLKRYSKPKSIHQGTAHLESPADTEITDPKPTEMPSPQKGKGRSTLNRVFILIGFICGPLLLVSWYFFVPSAGEAVISDILFLAPGILLIILGIVATIVRVKR